ncbi:MAG: DUF4038 domain-containing protein [Pirellulales bacterium]
MSLRRAARTSGLCIAALPLVLLFGGLPTGLAQAEDATPPRLRVRPDSTYLETMEGRPFFWMADTVWSGPAVATLDDWSTYLADRKAKRFNVVQFNAVCPWRVNHTDAEGNAAYTGRDPIAINERYFARLDKYYDAIERHGLVAAPVLIWAHRAGDAGVELSEADCIRLARYQVERYKHRSVVWILAGDNRYSPEESARWQRIGRAVFADRPEAVVTTHPTGMNWPWEQHGWRDEKWLSFLGYQSGHGDGDKTFAWIHSGPLVKAAQVRPARPIINFEPPYEGHVAYQSKQPHDAYSVRRASYWSLLSTPPAGITYGAHGIWSWQTESGQTPADHNGSGIAKRWDDAQRLPGSEQMSTLVELFTGMDFPWWQLRPAQAWLRTQPGRDDPAKFVAIAADDEGKSFIAYLPRGGIVELDPSRLGQVVYAPWWHDPEGKEDSLMAVPNAPGRFTAPSNSKDWLLIGGRPPYEWQKKFLPRP